MKRVIGLAMLFVLSTGATVASAADSKAEEAVRKASAQFYEALSSMANGDAAPLGAIWSHGAKVTTMHPIGGREIGWEQVGTSWANVAQLASDGTVELKDGWLRVLGDVAYELGNEQGHFKLAGHEVAIHGRVTNIYVKEDGAWKIVHHHVDYSPEMAGVLAQVAPAPDEE